MKQTKLLLLSLIFLFLFSNSVSANSNDVYVIPIKGEINKATYNFVNENVSKIIKNNPAAIIFEIDTYGGLIEEAEKIKTLITSLSVPTVSYVNNKAESAGVLITIASEKVVMANTATIGSAETNPNTEKIMSMWRSLLRDTAQYRNRNAEIIQAMADKNIVVEGISKEGNLVNLTSKEAVQYGISDSTASTYEEIVDYIGLSNANINVIDESMQIKLSKYIANPYISSILLTMGLVGLVLEVFTPGFGIGGSISLIGFGLYFGGNILAGNSSWTSVILFITGLVLLIIEAMMPGFGLPGISGVILFLVGIVLAMESLSMAILSVSIAIIITTFVSIILVKKGFKSPLLNKVVLDTEYKTEKGFVSSVSMNEYLNKEGITVTELRPAGFININGIKLDALSDEGFIGKEANVRVVRVEGSKIFVRRS